MPTVLAASQDVGTLLLEPVGDNVVEGSVRLFDVLGGGLE